MPDDVAEQEVTDLTVPEMVGPGAPKPQRFEVQIERDSETISMSSEELPPWIRDQIEAWCETISSMMQQKR